MYEEDYKCLMFEEMVLELLSFSLVLREILEKVKKV